MSLSKKFNKTSKKIKVTFKVLKEAAKDAEKIELLCEVLNWEPKVLEKQKSGDFKIDVEFDSAVTTSQFKYRYSLQDGSVIYENDWEADAYIPNGVDGDNSVVDLTKDVKVPETKEKEEKPAEEKKATKAKKSCKKTTKKSDK